ncbi:14579_t:CDS:2 [Gigaspora margarita]|uniref:14579_t:CDS:1 n=1 Tax=Gigaspora margarita TaxID=4874 RepID=A0ABN7VMP3_GIGMA|nr:14579_t:CDS:2 [Gigaspora margarita]
MRDILAKSRQLRIQLPVPQLKALNHFHKPVFDMEKPLVKILTRDIDGNELLQVILSNTLLSINYPAPSTDLHPDQFVEMGLVRFEAEKNKAFVNDPILLNWRIDNYYEFQYFYNSEKVTLDAQLWQIF